MKKYLLLLLTFGFLACNPTEETPDPDTTEVWNLTSFENQLVINYDSGDVIWRFNMTKNTLEIENNVQNHQFDAGQYDYIMTVDTLKVFFPSDTAVFARFLRGNSQGLFYDPFPLVVDDEGNFFFDVE
ncbi:MAG: hypothetical protein KJP21_09120 [Bacteroidia bacterium]|nr:hypothetical protein [Bacteroidia bacterium]NNJ54512.1 hypothetical protein [Bacteroidia bacterium]